MINKNLVRNGDQPEDLKSKTTSHWPLSLPQPEKVLMPPIISERDCGSERSFFPLFNPL